jgi:hypothetical protein
MLKPGSAKGEQNERSEQKLRETLWIEETTETTEASKRPFEPGWYNTSH